ncbi:MAG: choice-of-anchor J domain-containing protein [Candidatus Cloacimonetes bacterium]|nr:choice-of-anchor J domain-containing protein [Candidatus Cloacimonadota bacterium]
MKIIFFLIFLMLCMEMFAPTPHPLDIEVAYEGGVYPDTLIFQAWRTVNPNNILNNNSPDCFYPTGQTTWYLQIQCGSFTTWDAGDIVHVEVYDPNTSEGGSGDYTLNYDNFQLFPVGSGGIVLAYVPPLSFSLPENFHINEDDILEVDFGQYMMSLFGDELSLSHFGNSEIDVDINGSDVTFSAPENWWGTELITFIVVDQHANVENDQINIIFDSVNDPPVFDIPVPSFTINEDDSLWVDFSPFFSDVDNYNLTLTCSGNDNIDVQITVGEVVFHPDPDWNGSEVITFIVSDGVTRASASDEVEVIVNPINDAPVVNIPDSFSFLFGSEYIQDLTGMIWDVDGDELDISVSGNQQITPVIDGLLVTFETPTGWHGSETMEFCVDDNQQRDVVCDTVTVNILALDDTYLGLPVIEIDDGESFTVDLEISQLFEEWSVVGFSLTIEYDPYVLSWMGYSTANTIIGSGTVLVQEDVPGYIEISYMYYLPLTGAGALLHLDFDTFCFGESELDIQNVLFSTVALTNITDGYVTVNDIGLEHPPVALAGLDQTVDELTDVHLDGSASFDPDGDIITYLWTAPPQITLQNATTSTPSFTAPDVTEDTDFMINLVCSDGTFNSPADMLIVTVLYVNHAPVIMLPDNLSFPEDGSLIVDFSAYITDIDPDDLTLDVSGNSDIMVDITDLQVTFSAAENWFGSEIMTFTIDDNLGRLTDSDDIEIIVEPVNDAPEADAGDDQMAHDGQIVTLDATGSSDIEGDELTFMWIAPGGIMLSDPYSANPTFTAPQTTDPEDYTFTLQVSDDQTRETDTDEVIITIFDDEPALPQYELLPDNEVLFTWLAPGTGGSGEELEQGFEGLVIPQGWMNIDHDGDGYGWYILNQTPHSGTKCIASASFWNNNALEPDNWLLTPQIEIGGISTLQFWISADDQYHYSEHYSVLLSTTDTALASFTELLHSETLINDQWHEVNIPLVDYAGENVYIAFVHHDCTDQLLLKLDDVRIYNAGRDNRITRDLTGYNVYYDEGWQGFTEERSFLFTGVYGPHTAGVEAVYDDGNSEIISIDFDHTPAVDEDLIPEMTSLQATYPNPFNPQTTIDFDLAKDEKVIINIFNVKGQKITELVKATLPAGNHKVVWNAGNNPSGLYFVQLKTAELSLINKIILMK